MGSLLQRQLKKHLSDEVIHDKKLQGFLKVIDQSYNNYENQLKMSQRAMKISSNKLFDANQKLREEAESRKKIINSLDYVINVLNLKSNNKDLTPVVNFARHIEKQSKEIIRINKQREVLLKNLELKNQELNDYAQIVSHDLKSPLRSINALANWILQDNEKDIDEEGKKNFELILQNVEKMDGMVSGILKYSTIDKVDIPTYKVDLKQLVLEILEIMYIPKHIRIKTDTPLPVIVGDKFRLQLLFQNLIQNAIDNIDKKKGVITIGAEELDHDWQFYIKDNGKGIPVRYHKKIFKIFEKIHDNPGTTGIGLSIAKRILDFYGGDIWLKSKVVEGTTFYFTLLK